MSARIKRFGSSCRFFLAYLPLTTDPLSNCQLRLQHLWCEVCNDILPEFQTLTRMSHRKHWNVRECVRGTWNLGPGRCLKIENKP